jgi:23S rRNA pseudouridine1911/1915/1917 synthase
VTEGGRDESEGSPTLELTVPRAAAGERLDRYLAGLAAVGSRAEAERLLRLGRVSVDGRARAKSHRLAGGERIDLDPLQREAAPMEPQEVEGIAIRYADEYLLVVDKPAGVAVHPGAGRSTRTLVHGLLAHGIGGGEQPERPGIVHRLDRDTSGLMVVARSADSHRQLQALVRRRALTREYLALVRGRPRSWRGRIEAPIGRDRRDPTRMSLHTDRPRDAVTHFEVAELLATHALLRIRLETGRTHQIRVHLAAIDLPVSGDPVYGVAEDLGLKRQFLHAARLAFAHPVTGAAIDVESPLPAELAAALERARR